MGRLSASENICVSKSLLCLGYMMVCFVIEVYCESFTVGPPQPDMIGLPGMSGLCIFG